MLLILLTIINKQKNCNKENEQINKKKKTESNLNLVIIKFEKLLTFIQTYGTKLINKQNKYNNKKIKRNLEPKQL